MMIEKDKGENVLNLEVIGSLRPSTHNLCSSYLILCILIDKVVESKGPAKKFALGRILKKGRLLKNNIKCRAKSPIPQTLNYTSLIEIICFVSGSDHSSNGFCNQTRR